MPQHGRSRAVYVRDARSPVPSSEAASRVMSRNRARDTGPEMALRRALWAAGARGYRTHARGVPGRPDIAFPRARLAVFVHGCFWHGCPRHSHLPRSNSAFWRAKFERNRARDARKLEELKAAGWSALVLWEHEVAKDAARAAGRVVRALARAKRRVEGGPARQRRASRASGPR